MSENKTQEEKHRRKLRATYKKMKVFKENINMTGLIF